MLRFFSVGLWLLAAGCGGECYHPNGQTYQMGESVPVGCVSCTCQRNGSFECTDIPGCLDDTGDGDTDTDDSDTDTDTDGV